MTISEFRAWLEGFSEAIDGAPTAEQWEKIKEKIGTIAAPASAPTYVPYPIAYPYQPNIGQEPWRWGEITGVHPQAFQNQLSWNRAPYGYGVSSMHGDLQ